MRAIAERKGEFCGTELILSDAKTPDEIVIEQLALNIQARPSREEEAPAIAGAYEFARYVDDGITRAEFCRTYGVADAYLRDALYYVELPDTVQDAVGPEGMSFGLAVEIAKRIDLLNYYYEVVGSDDIERDVRAELARFAMLYTNLKSVDKAITRIRSDAKGLRQELLRRSPNHLADRPDLFQGISTKTPDLVLFQEESARAIYVRTELSRLMREHTSAVSVRADRMAQLAIELDVIEKEETVAAAV